MALEVALREAIQQSLASLLIDNAIFLGEQLHVLCHNEDSALLLASCYHRAGKPNCAQVLLQNAASPSARYLLAVCCFQLGRYQDAQLALSANAQVVDDHGANVAGGAAGWHLLGDICRRLGAHERAATCYRKALALNRFLWSSYAALCELGVADKAEATFDEQAVLAQAAAAAAATAAATAMAETATGASTSASVSAAAVTAAPHLSAAAGATVDARRAATASIVGPSSSVIAAINVPSLARPSRRVAVATTLAADVTTPSPDGASAALPAPPVPRSRRRQADDGVVTTRKIRRSARLSFSQDAARTPGFTPAAATPSTAAPVSGPARPFLLAHAFGIGQSAMSTPALDGAGAPPLLTHVDADEPFSSDEDAAANTSDAAMEADADDSGDHQQQYDRQGHQMYREFRAPVASSSPSHSATAGGGGDGGGGGGVRRIAASAHIGAGAAATASMAAAAAAAAAASATADVSSRPFAVPLSTHVTTLSTVPATTTTAAAAAAAAAATTLPAMPPRTGAPLAPASAASAQAMQAGAVQLTRVLCAFAEAYRLLCEYDSRRALTALALVPAPFSAHGWAERARGRAHFELAEYADADRCFTRAQQLAPHVLAGVELHSTALWHLKRESTLVTLAHRLSAFDRLAPQTWLVVGNCFSLQNDHESALKFFARAIQLDTFAPYAHTLCGHEYLAIDDQEAAMRCFRTALRYDPRHYNAWYGLALVYIRQRRHVLAESHLWRALEQNPHNSVLYYYIGTVLQAKGEAATALKAYRKAAVLNRRNSLARYKMASVLYALGEYEVARKELIALLDLLPKEACIRYLLGKVYVRLGERDRARTLLYDAFDMDAKNAVFIKSEIDKLMAETTATTAASMDDSGGPELPNN